MKKEILLSKVKTKELMEVYENVHCQKEYHSNTLQADARIMSLYVCTGFDGIWRQSIVTVFLLLILLLFLQEILH